MKAILPPQTESELFERASLLAGLTWAELAEQAEIIVPQKMLHAKGWLGQVLELLLGATGGNISQPDFNELGIELKTIPIDARGKPLETTYVCTVPTLEESLYLNWKNSRFYQKIKKVLWFPYLGERGLEPAKKRLAQPLLWSISEDEEFLLRQDFEELMERFSLEGLASINAHQGMCLQIRPKADNSRAKCLSFDREGRAIKTVPRGFYLRTSFTGRILKKYSTL